MDASFRDIPDALVNAESVDDRDWYVDALTFLLERTSDWLFSFFAAASTPASSVYVRDGLMPGNSFSSA